MENVQKRIEVDFPAKVGTSRKFNLRVFDPVKEIESREVLKLFV